MSSSTGMGPVERRRRRKLPPIERPRSAPIHNMGFPGSGGPNSTNSDLDPAGNGAGKRTYNFLAKIFFALYLNMYYPDVSKTDYLNGYKVVTK